MSANRSFSKNRSNLRSGSVHSTDVSVCKIDIVKATKPLDELNGEEYFRALKLHADAKTIQRSDYDIPIEVYDAIERIVKQRLNEGRFGYDHSKLITLQLEINDSFIKGTNQFKRNDIREVQQSKASQTLLSKLESTDEPSRYSLTYEEWRMKKITEERLKKKLIMEYIKDLNNRREIQDKIHEEVEEEKMRKVHEWTETKREEARDRLREFQNMKKEAEQENNANRVKAEQKFRNWLRNNFIKLSEAKRLEKVAHNLKKENRVKTEEKVQKRKQDAEIAYQEWLHEKSRQRSESCISKAHRRKSRKSPLLLAYGRNKISKAMETPIPNIQIASPSEIPTKESFSQEEIFHDYLNESY